MFCGWREEGRAGLGKSDGDRAGELEGAGTRLGCDTRWNGGRQSSLPHDSPGNHDSARSTAVLRGEHAVLQARSRQRRYTRSLYPLAARARHPGSLETHAARGPRARASLGSWYASLQPAELGALRAPRHRPAPVRRYHPAPGRDACLEGAGRTCCCCRACEDADETSQATMNVDEVTRHTAGARTRPRRF